MVTEEHEIASGWPLGLENMNTRLIVAEIHNSLHVPSSSFSSFSSSNLDTESTTSFFRDNSVSLGRLIGIRPGDKGSMYFPNKFRLQRHETTLERGPDSEVSHGRGFEMSRATCIQQLLNIITRRSQSKNNSRQ